MTTRHIKAAEATGPALDWLVAKALGHTLHKDALLDGLVKEGWWVSGPAGHPNIWVPLALFDPSKDWAQGGPIIEREKIDLDYSHSEMCWQAVWHGPHEYAERWDDTPLVAAMRCYVASKLGPEVEVPEELFA